MMFDFLTDEVGMEAYDAGVMINGFDDKKG